MGADGRGTPSLETVKSGKSDTVRRKGACPLWFKPLYTAPRTGALFPDAKNNNGCRQT